MSSSSSNISSSTPTQVIIGGFGPIIERTPTPFPFLSRRNNNADTNADTDRDPAALSRAEAHREILCGAIRALCRCEPSRPIDVRALLFPPDRTHPVPANSSTVGETIPEEQAPLVAAPTPTIAQTLNQNHGLLEIPTVYPPPQFNIGMLPAARNYPALDRLAKGRTALVVDNSCHMSERWSEVAICIARTATLIVNAIGKRQLSPEEYPYNYEGSVKGIRSTKNEISPSLSLYFMDSAVKMRDLTYPDTVLKAFEAVPPVSKRTPLGEKLFDIVADMFPYSPPNQTPESERPYLNIIVLTAGYITDDPVRSIESFRSAMEALDIKDEQVHITLFQVGCNGRASNLLDSYDQVYNSWGSESGRNMVYTEICEDGRQTIGVRSLLRAVTRGMQRRGFF